MTHLDNLTNLMETLGPLVVLILGQVPPAVLVHKGIILFIACISA